MNTVNKRKVSAPTRNKTSDSMVFQHEAYSKRYLSSQISTWGNDYINIFCGLNATHSWSKVNHHIKILYKCKCNACRNNHYSWNTTLSYFVHKISFCWMDMASLEQRSCINNKRFSLLSVGRIWPVLNTDLT
jgi:hypothetical protein